MSNAVVVLTTILLTASRATGYVVVPLLRPTFASIVAIGIMQATPRMFSRCWGGGFPDMIPLRKLLFRNRCLGLLQCEMVTTTAEGVEVNTIADSRPFVVGEFLLRIALFAYIFRIGITARPSVKSSTTSVPYLIRRYSSMSHSSTVSSMRSSLNISPMSTT